MTISHIIFLISFGLSVSGCMDQMEFTESSHSPWNSSSQLITMSYDTIWVDLLDAREMESEVERELHLEDGIQNDLGIRVEPSLINVHAGDRGIQFTAVFESQMMETDAHFEILHAYGEKVEVGDITDDGFFTPTSWSDESLEFLVRAYRKDDPQVYADAMVIVSPVKAPLDLRGDLLD